MNRPHRVAILVTAIPPILFIIAFIVSALLNPELAGAEELNIVDIWGQISLALLAIAFISLIVFLIRGKQEIARGIAKGLGIAFVVWLIAFIVVSALYGE
jgi:hypothetical protein